MVIVFIRNRNFEKNILYFITKFSSLVIDHHAIKRTAAIFYFAVSLGLNLSGEYHRQQLYYNESFHFSNIQ